MKKQDETYLFSATDLANFLGCTHLTTLERQVAEGTVQREFRHDPTLELLIELGLAHETAFLNHLRDQGHSVVEIPGRGEKAGIEKTINAMRGGVDVIAQAALEAPPWHGIADVLVKVDRPSRLGEWSYQVIDTKLSQTTRATAVLQLCLYTEIVASLQGESPSHMHIVKPGDPFTYETLRCDDFMSYYRMVKRQFELFVDGPVNVESYPTPCSHCEICSWWPRCNQQWRQDDHLTFVAGISKSQISELHRDGTRTLAKFADLESPLSSLPNRGSMSSFVKVHRQAQIQFDGRKSGTPRYEFNALEPARGFCRLPEPDPGDVFFDIEGNPRAVGEGLEYLFGIVVTESGARHYQGLWALSKAEERRLFERFIDEMMARWEEYPGMHIYHYAPYEPSALKRLATRHATREAELDELLRAGRFVDLYAVVRQGIRASVESYSIKQLEQFYGYQRLEVLEAASKALREVERLIELGVPEQVSVEHRQIVETYNGDDCCSTAELREWLERLRSEFEEQLGEELPRPESLTGEPSERVREEADETQRVFEALIADIVEPKGDDQRSRWLLAHLLDYFRREDKCSWWEFFRMHDLEHDELLHERKAISGLQFIGEVAGGENDRLPTHRYAFDPQEMTVDEGKQVVEVMGGNVGTVTGVDYEHRMLDIKKTGKSVGLHPTAVFEMQHVSPGSMPEAILDFGREVLGGSQDSARYDLLARNNPRLKSLSLPLDGEPLEAAIRLVLDLDNSTLPIQGPPGAGKTYLASHMIAALAKAGKRVGVTAVSHKVIRNLLAGVHEKSKGTVDVGHQTSRGANEHSFITQLTNRTASLKALNAGTVVGATAWLWSSPEAAGALDYLFIDEAGQMSLAMALAAGRAAKNIVLLGDPQQLEQPQQGTHPDGAEAAALTHLLDGHDTIPPERGLFLDHTWRLHPEICRFTSEQYYEGRLESRVGLENQAIVGGSPFTGSGLRYVPVVHENNQARADEEVDAIARLMNTLLDGTHRWIDADGKESPLTLDDILVVAPYNAQVNALSRELPTGARVGTVDKFQGQEAPIVIYSMTCSTADDAPRGLDFVFSRNRFNVATSRAMCLVFLVASPSLVQPECKTPQQMRLANGVCRFLELAETLDANAAG